MDGRDSLWLYNCFLVDCCGGNDFEIGYFIAGPCPPCSNSHYNHNCCCFVGFVYHNFLVMVGSEIVILAVLKTSLTFYSTNLHVFCSNSRLMCLRCLVHCFKSWSILARQAAGWGGTDFLIKRVTDVRISVSEFKSAQSFVCFNFVVCTTVVMDDNISGRNLDKTSVSSFSDTMFLILARSKMDNLIRCRCLRRTRFWRSWSFWIFLFKLSWDWIFLQ